MNLAPHHGDELLPPTEWVGGGVLDPVHSLRTGAPAYSGTLHIQGGEHPVDLWWIRDGRGFDALAFDRDTTAMGCLWPAFDKRNPASADYFGMIRVDESRWRLRAWRAGDGALKVRVKA